MVGPGLWVGLMWFWSCEREKWGVEFDVCVSVCVLSVCGSYGPTCRRGGGGSGRRELAASASSAWAMLHEWRKTERPRNEAVSSPVAFFVTCRVPRAALRRFSSHFQELRAKLAIHWQARAEFRALAVGPGAEDLTG